MFGFFKKKSTASAIPAGKPAVASDPPRLPTVEAPPELFLCHAEMFHKEMATVTPFTAEEIQEMLAFIQAGEGGFLNRHHYHQAVYDRYFSRGDWRWPEFEKWQAIFAAHGSTPISWPQWDGNPYGIGLYELLMRFIHFKAMTLHNQRRRERLGLKSKHLTIQETEKPFVEMALKMDPRAFPPFFPTDTSISQADTSFLRGGDDTA